MVSESSPIGTVEFGSKDWISTDIIGMSLKAIISSVASLDELRILDSSSSPFSSSVLVFFFGSSSSISSKFSSNSFGRTSGSGDGLTTSSNPSGTGLTSGKT